MKAAPSGAAFFVTGPGDRRAVGAASQFHLPQGQLISAKFAKICYPEGPGCRGPHWKKGQIMPNFIFAYHGGRRPESPEEGERLMAAWQAWMEGLGAALVEGGNPVGLSKTVTATGIEDNGGANPLSGYSIVAAVDIDAATGMAQGCPHLEMGTVEVAELLVM